MSLVKKDFYIEGMSCEHCKNSVETATQSLDGVKSSIVDLENKKLTLEYDSSKVNDESIKKTIEDAGYELK